MVSFIFYSKSNPQFHVERIGSIFGLVFIWSNGIYWWVILRYPRIEVAKGQFAAAGALVTPVNVPSTYQYDMTFSANSGSNGLWTVANSIAPSYAINSTTPPANANMN